MACMETLSLQFGAILMLHQIRSQSLVGLSNEKMVRNMCNQWNMGLVEP